MHTIHIYECQKNKYDINIWIYKFIIYSYNIVISMNCLSYLLTDDIICRNSIFVSWNIKFIVLKRNCFKVNKLQKNQCQIQTGLQRCIVTINMQNPIKPANINLMTYLEFYDKSQWCIYFTILYLMFLRCLSLFCAFLCVFLSLR